MKRLVISILTLGVLSITAFAATRAYFSDQEEVLGNTISTGQVDIDLRNDVSHEIHISNLMPGVWTEPLQLGIYNMSNSYPVKYKFNSQDPTETINGLYWNINVKVRHTHAGTADPANWPVVFNGKLKDMEVFSYQSNVSEILGVNITHDYFFQFQLDPSAGNQYQGGSATFDLYVDAIQQEASWN